jgi:hypothetical protein
MIRPAAYSCGILDGCGGLSHNRDTLTRLSLVLLVCLSVQTSAMAAPFAHRHADAAHVTDHHDGRVAHQHLAAHAVVDVHHHDHQQAAGTRWSVSEPAAALDAAPEAVSAGSGTLNGRPLSYAGTLAPPTEVVEELAVPTGVVTPPDDVGHRLASPPDLSTFALRGPPR